MDQSQIAVGNYPYLRYSLRYFLNSMQRMQVQKIELYAAGPHLYLDDFDYFRVKDLAKTIREAGLEVVCLTPEQCVYPISISADEPVMRRRSVNYFLKAIDIAETLGAPMVLVTPGTSMFDLDREKETAFCIENLQLLAQHAERRGILLVLEALAVTTSHIANTPQQLKKLIDTVDSPALQPMLDVDGAARMNLRPKDYFSVFPGQIRHIHFIDGFPGGHVALGDGTLDLDGYLDEIAAEGYTGSLALEILDRQYYLRPDAAVKKSLLYLNNNHNLKG